MAKPAKLSKASVGYSLGGEVCGCCAHWIEEEEDEKTETGACELVQGEIDECYWCKLFKRRGRDSGDTIAGAMAREY